MLTSSRSGKGRSHSPKERPDEHPDTNLQAVATGEPRKPQNFPAMLDAFKGEIARALPRHLSPDRMTRIALTEFRKNPKLAECDPRSVFAAVIQASQIGLEPGLMGQAYLIPYKGECQLQIGYQGLLELVRRTGKVKRVEAHVVRDGDKFVYRTGLTTVLEHEPMLEGEPGEMRLAYAVAEFTDGGFHVEVMSKSQILAIRDRSQNVQNAKKYGKKTPWDTDPDEMCRKTLMRRISKYLPKSAELATALALDDAAITGRQVLSVDDAIANTWAPPALTLDEEITSVDTTSSLADAKDAPVDVSGAREVEPPTPPGKAPTYAEVMDSIIKAKTLDEADLAASLFAHIGGGKKQQEELRDAYAAKRIELGGEA